MAGPSLTDADYAELARSGARLRPIRRAAAVARFDGLMLACFGIISLIAGLFGVSQLLVGCVLLGLAWNELAGGRALLRLNPSAPRRLAINQLLLAAAVVGYASWMGLQSMHPSADLSAHESEFDTAFGPGGTTSIEQLATTISVGVYALLAVGSIVFQGLTAWYYVSKGPILRQHLALTPEWVVRVERIVSAA